MCDSVKQLWVGLKEGEAEEKFRGHNESCLMTQSKQKLRQNPITEGDRVIMTFLLGKTCRNPETESVK